MYIRYLIGDLRPTLNEMNAFTCLLRLPSRIHSPFHFKCSAALFWVAALSPRPPRCTHHSCLCPPPFSSPDPIDGCLSHIKDCTFKIDRRSD